MPEPTLMPGVGTPMVEFDVTENSFMRACCARRCPSSTAASRSPTHRVWVSTSTSTPFAPLRSSDHVSRPTVNAGGTHESAASVARLRRRATP
jgi:hypothetical protein